MNRFFPASSVGRAIGRVGALAVALGIGVVIVGPVVAAAPAARAETEQSTDTADAAATAGPRGGRTAPAAARPQSPDRRDDSAAPTGGSARRVQPSFIRPAVPSRTVDLPSPTQSVPVQPAGQVVAIPLGVGPAPVAPSPQAVPPAALGGAARALLGSLLGSRWGTPAESPVAWAVAAVSRRQGRTSRVTAAPALATAAATTSGTTTRITWAWGTNTVLNFVPATDRLDFGWFQPNEFDVSESAGSTRIAVVGNNQTYTLNGVPLSGLQMTNIVAQDSRTVQKWQTLLSNSTVTPVVPPTVSIANATVGEGNSGTANLAFTVSLSKASDTTVTVAYATSNGTATAGQDYTPASGTLTFTPGVTNRQVTVPVIGDTTIEPNETVTVTLSNPSGATLGSTAIATGTIVNDDTAAPPVPGTTAPWGASFFAPYVDMAGWPVPDLLQISKSTGASRMVAAFMQATPDGKAAWAGLPVLTPGSANDQAQAIDRSIAAFKAAGGDVMVSFGGANGTSLAQSYAARGLSAQALADAYAGVVNAYGVKYIDFDIEGAAVADPTSVALNNAAIGLLQKARPDLQVWYTLPVLPSGLTADGLRVVDNALKSGVKIGGVNVMAMDYGEYAAPTSGPNAQTMGTYAIRAAESTYNQLAPLYAKYGQSFGWNQVGVTPMIGVNDVTSEVFTLADTQALEDFARAKGMGMLSMWSVTRDNPGSLGQATPTASGLGEPAGSFSKILIDYGTVNAVTYPVTGGGTTGPVQGGTTTKITWSWGTNTVLSFDTSKDRLDFGWFQPANFDISEQSGSTRITITGNSQSYTLSNVPLRQLRIDNIVALDPSTLAKWQTAIANAGQTTTPTTPPTVSIAGATANEGNSGSAGMAFTVTLSRAATTPVTVAYTTSNGTATAGQDYTATSGTLTFAPGVTAQQVSVPVTGDTTVEPNETLTVTLSNPTGATLATATATGTITNDDSSTPVTTPPTVSIAGATANEGNSGSAGMTFTVTLSRAATTPVTVAYTTSNGTATAGQDYTATSGTLTFAPGVTAQQVSVPVTGDTTVEPNETLTVTLSNPTGATLATATATGTITNDDSSTPVTTPPTVSIAGATANEGNSGSAGMAFTITLSRAATTPVTVAYTTSNGTATAGQDYTATSGTLTFAPGVTAQQVSVPVTGDTTVEPNETLTVTLSNPTGATLATATATGTIANDDGTSAGGIQPVTGLPIAAQNKVIAAYFPEWGIYGRNFQVADIPGEQLTHVIYSFLNVTPAGEVAIYDSFAATDKRFAAGDTVSGEADQWYYPPEDPRSQQTVWGNFNQLAQLKQKYPHIRVSIAIGGWTLSGNFSSATSTAAGREKLANSIVNFLDTYRMFDGVDFDWEYPGGGGLEGNSVSPNDGANYAELLKLVRQKLDVLGQQQGRRYEITVASPAGYDKIANFNLAGLAPYVDFFNLMAYDFHGTWEKTTGHQSAFTGDPNGYDVKTAVGLYLRAGVAPNKIVLGAPMYTRGWSGVADGGDGGYLESTSGAAPGTFEAGVYDYKDLLRQVQDPASGWKLYWDDNAQAVYVYNAAQKLFSSFETPTSIAQKAQWGDSLGLRGMMFWDITNDALDSPESLLKAAYSSVVLREDLSRIRSRSTLRSEVIIGGDGVIAPLPSTGVV